jgi:hypothetical protein
MKLPSDPYWISDAALREHAIPRIGSMKLRPADPECTETHEDGNECVMCWDKP